LSIIDLSFKELSVKDLTIKTFRVTNHIGFRASDQKSRSIVFCFFGLLNISWRLMIISRMLQWFKVLHHVNWSSKALLSLAWQGWYNIALLATTEWLWHSERTL